jgi:hypothetical protein
MNTVPMTPRRQRLLAPVGYTLAALGVLAGCTTDNPASNNPLTPLGEPMALISPATQGELWACKFSVDPVTKLPNGDVTSGRVSAALTTGDGTLDPAVSGGNSVLIGYNTPAPTPQCVKVWTGGTSATVAVTEDPEPGSALLFYRLVKRTPGAAYDDIYFSLDPVLSPPSEGPYTASVQVDNGAAYEIWFKNVTVTTPPPPNGEGCTYTQGYWKTHSRQGPAPYDAGWQKLGVAEEATLFFNSGASWYQVWQTPPRGNAFYNLAHQYMAARLNVLNGASTTSAVDGALSGAESLFGGLAAGSTTLTSNQRTQALAWAETLDDYNNGLTGPGHCP